MITNNASIARPINWHCTVHISHLQPYFPASFSINYKVNLTIAINICVIVYRVVVNYIHDEGEQNSDCLVIQYA